MSRQINLYNAAFRKQRDWLSSRNVLMATLLSVLLVSLGAGMARWSVESRALQARSINQQLLGARAAFSELTRTLSARKADPALAQEVLSAQAALDAAKAALDLLHGMTGADSQPVVGDMMRAFSRTASDGLWLTGFVVAEGGRQLEIRGRMTDQALLPGYLRRLEAEPVFQGRRFASLDMKGGEWVPPVAPGAAAVNPENSPERRPERWFVEFALRTTEVPKAPADAGGAR